MLVLPGLGSFVVGRRLAGVIQAVAALAGAGLCLWWLALFAQQWMTEGAFPMDGGEILRVGVIGVGVFGVAWVWALATSVSVVRTMREANQRDTENTEKSTENTERTRGRQKTGESSAGERAGERRAREWDFLVTGTDTGVGKTIVAAAMVIALEARGRRVVGFKPAETGVEPGAATDSGLLARASGVDDPQARPLLSAAEALAPAVAADRAGAAVSGEAVDARIRALRRGYDSIVVEGAGGVGVPLAWDYTALDLASRAGLSAVVVARPGLGTLNHVWLTVEALRARGIPVAAIVLNGRSDPPDLAEATNPAALARLLPGVRCVSVPRFGASDPWEVANLVAPLIASIIE